ncbi:hypothetical protein CDAR_221681 [Caerostris darwini]|uniref:Uncharacterized protein n=1 Tax=Caerostris darwini TaxID=1538125 RepID=A0AAV4WMH8_9ARAC|nr:hypothetical protein CDAR_221681 [Caerostris darwini]
MGDPRNKLKPSGRERGGREKWASGSLNGIETAEIRLASHQMAEIIKSHSDADHLTRNSPFVVCLNRKQINIYMLFHCSVWGIPLKILVTAIFQLKKAGNSSFEKSK